MKNYFVNKSLRDQISKSDNNYIRFHVTFRLEIILFFYYDERHLRSAKEVYKFLLIFSNFIYLHKTHPAGTTDGFDICEGFISF